MDLFQVDELSQFLYIRFLAVDSANAFSLSAARELAVLTKKYKRWTKPVVLTSAHPRVFCSGGNLTDYKKLKGKAAGLKVNREITKVLNDFGSWPVVKLAVVNGDVLGGGMEWLARFDFRWSVPNVLFSFWQRRIGLSPGWGGGSVWVEKIGENALRQLLVEAAPLSAPAALRRGLVDRLIPHWKLDSELDQWTRTLGTPSARAANSWSARREQKIFSDLWLAAEHAAVLKNWNK